MAKIRPFQPWEGSKPNDIHIRLTKQMITSNSFANLAPSAVKLYIYMKLWANGGLEFDYSWSLAKTKNIFGSNTTFISAKNELISKGFIECIRTAKCSRLPNRYKFSSNWNKKNSH